MTILNAALCAALTYIAVTCVRHLAAELRYWQGVGA